MLADPFQEPGDFVFYSSDRGRPISHHKIDVDFARALEKGLGINGADREERGL